MSNESSTTISMRTETTIPDLPLEILDDIFALVNIIRPTRHVIQSVSKFRAPGDPRIRLTSVYTLALVCRLWKDAVFSNRAFWSTITIQLSFHKPLEAPEANHLQAVLNRAGTSKLDITIDSDNLEINERRTMSNPGFSMMVTLLAASVPRWTRLTLMKGSLFLFATAFDHVMGRLTALEYLYTESTKFGWYKTTISQAQRFFRRLPCLSHVEMSGWPIIINKSSVRHLTIRDLFVGSEVNDPLRQISGSRDLTHLELRDVGLMVAIPYLPTPPRFLSHSITHLSIINSVKTCTVLELPSLADLSVTDIKRGETPQEIVCDISQLIEHSSCFLSSLTISHRDFGHFLLQYHLLYKHLFALKSLTVEVLLTPPFSQSGSAEMNAIIRRFCRELISSPGQLPRLNHARLNVAGCAAESSLSQETLSLLQNAVLGRSELRRVEVHICECRADMSPDIRHASTVCDKVSSSARNVPPGEDECRRILECVTNIEAASSTKVEIKLFGVQISSTKRWTHVG